jgi:hypothetical protein
VEKLIKVAMMVLTDRQSGPGFGARMTTGALCTGFAIIMMTAGLGCAMAALWIFLEPRIGSTGAALTVAGVLLFASGITMLVARSSFTPDEADENAPVLGEELLEELQERFQDHKGLALIVALVAGLVVGRSQR